MANTIKPKRSNTSSNTPSLQEGEIAVNVADKKLWIGDNSPTPTPVLIVDGNADCFAIVSADVTNWNTAYGWGNHASAGYLTTETDPVFAASAAYSITSTDTDNWDSAYTERHQWDGGSTNLVAATGRTSLGGTTVGSNLFTLTNPSAVTFLKVNANNTVTAESASTFRTSIGAGTGNGTITSIATTSPITGGTITSTGTIGINASSTNTASYVVQRDASGNFAAGTITASLTGTASTATNVAGGSGGTIPYQSAANTTAMLANGTANQILQANGGTSAPSWVSTLTGVTITGLKETKTSPTISSGTLTLNCSLGNVFAVSLNANITTLSFTNVPANGTAYGLTLMLTADGTARTITWGGSVKWAGGTAPTLTSTNAKVDVYVLVTHDGGTTWYAFTSGQNL